MRQTTTSIKSLPSRRSFLKSAAGVSATAIAGPVIVPRSVFGANAPSNRITVGVIGLGTRGIPDMQLFMQNDDVQVVALCDVNRSSKGYRDENAVMGLEPGLQAANEYYASRKRSGEFQGIAATSDFREIIGRDDIDVVAIVTPDHWHAAMTIMAAEAGKDIFCQKPLSLTVQDGKDMVAAVRKHQRILQTGSQWRSHARVRFACELVRNGYIGELQTIRALIALNNKQGPGPGWKPMPVPAGFDYPMWLGPAPDAPYHKDRCIYKFRFNLDYSGGQITNFGAHALDIAQCGNGTSLTGPVEVEGIEAEWPPAGSLFNTALRAEFRARYANGVELICASEPPYFGTRFEGSEGWVEFSQGSVKTYPESLASVELKANDQRLPVVNPLRTVAKPGDFYADHVRNFLDCVKSREEPIEPVEVGHRTATICHLGNIALQQEKRLDWDPVAEQFVNDDGANRMLARPRRSDWNSA
ncbi:MAG: Gfo/Idh/MocA family oxidoreductase [Planctomycetales bacterium]|nr:Gfo/Idh/MocA family oxidoreductase [Planctomycetales bacterium]